MERSLCNSETAELPSTAASPQGSSLDSLCDISDVLLLPDDVCTPGFLLTELLSRCWNSSWNTPTHGSITKNCCCLPMLRPFLGSVYGNPTRNDAFGVVVTFIWSLLMFTWYYSEISSVRGVTLGGGAGFVCTRYHVRSSHFPSRPTKSSIPHPWTGSRLVWEG